MPVAAVNSCGSFSVSCGSSSASCGKMYGLITAALKWVCELVMIVEAVTSLPVPAVVGMATTGRPGCGIRFTPS